MFVLWPLYIIQKLLHVCLHPELRWGLSIMCALCAVTHIPNLVQCLPQACISFAARFDALLHKPFEYRPRCIIERVIMRNSPATCIVNVNFKLDRMEFADSSSNLNSHNYVGEFHSRTLIWKANMQYWTLRKNKTIGCKFSKRIQVSLPTLNDCQQFAKNAFQRKGCGKVNSCNPSHQIDSGKVTYIFPWLYVNDYAVPSFGIHMYLFI